MAIRDTPRCELETLAVRAAALLLADAANNSSAMDARPPSARRTSCGIPDGTLKPLRCCAMCAAEVEVIGVASSPRSSARACFAGDRHPGTP